MKKLVSKSWLIPILAMIMVIGMGLTAMAVPIFPDDVFEHGLDCQHAGVVHFYATGITYFNSHDQECVEGCMYNADGTKLREFYEGSGVTTLKSRFRGNTLKGWYYYIASSGEYVPCRLNTEEPLEEEKEYIDYDTFKSEAPSKTVTASDTLGAKQFYDLKVHAADERTKANQAFLLQYYIGANAKILLTENIYPRRDLSITENGSLQTLTWNNLPKNQAGPVYSVVYNQTDKAYVISGTLDANGTAVFSGFKLRPASTITICK